MECPSFLNGCKTLANDFERYEDEKLKYYLYHIVYSRESGGC